LTDVFDRAQEREEEMRSDALAELARRANGHARLPRRTHCAVCEEPIPPKRLQALPGVQTCVDCQTDLEKGLLQ
jgi:phage/conjugal plasmid C-4 type zinc finger TraR family protein